MFEEIVTKDGLKFNDLEKKIVYFYLTQTGTIVKVKCA